VHSRDFYILHVNSEVVALISVTRQRNAILKGIEQQDDDRGKGMPAHPRKKGKKYREQEPRNRGPLFFAKN
jgi:hypothetical protein